MIVLGADTHKRSHTIAPVAAATGELLSERTVAVGRRGFGALLVWARGFDCERVWALEDCQHVSGLLERFLIGRGERVLRIPTHLSARARRSARRRGKSDPIDALNLARAALQEGLKTFPVAHRDGSELDLRLRVDHRERLVRYRVELNSTLLWHLHDLWPRTAAARRRAVLTDRLGEEQPRGSRATVRRLTSPRRLSRPSTCGRVDLRTGRGCRSATVTGDRCVSRTWRSCTRRRRRSGSEHGS
jgi:transposase